MSCKTRRHKLYQYSLVSFIDFHSLSSPLSLCIVFDAISSNIDEVLSINWSTNVFIFRDFNPLHEDQPTYSDGPGKVLDLVNAYNFCISNYITQMAHFPNLIVDCATDSPASLDLIFSCNASMCPTMIFFHKDIFTMLFSMFPLTFLSISKWDTLFQCIAYDYCFAN